MSVHLFIRHLLCQCSVAEQQERLIEARHLNQQHQLSFERVYVVRRQAQDCSGNSLCQSAIELRMYCSRTCAAVYAQ